MTAFECLFPAGGLTPGQTAVLAREPVEARGLPLVLTPDGFGPARVGEVLEDGARPLLKDLGAVWQPVQGSGLSTACRLVEALDRGPAGEAQALSRRRTGLSLAWITLSDKGAAGQRQDTAGPLIAELAAGAATLSLTRGHLIPDEEPRLRALLVRLALEDGFDLVVTTGGTGVGPRDVTPEAVLAVAEKRLPGFERAMTAVGLTKTPHAMISRAVAATLGRTLILTLPGSPKAVREGLSAVLPAVPHAVEKLLGDPGDCGR